MDPAAILVGLVIGAIAAIIIARPLGGHRLEGLHAFDQELSSLQAEHDRILTLIEELEMDHAIGKILDEEYKVERARLMKQGAENLRLMDELLPAHSGEDEQGVLQKSLEDELEAAVTKFRQTKIQPGPDHCGQCGAKILVGDRFCAACGAKISPPEDRRR
jgi:hypothetical protein